MALVVTDGISLGGHCCICCWVCPIVSGRDTINVGLVADVTVALVDIVFVALFGALLNLLFVFFADPLGVFVDVCFGLLVMGPDT